MKASLLLGFLFCIAFSFDTSAQSIFELKYRFYNVEDTNTYNVFLVRYDDGTGFYRVRVYDDESKQYIVADLEMEEHYAVDNGVTNYNKLYFKGKNPKVIVGDKNYIYLPESFWFYKSTKTGLFEPWGITSRDDANFVAQGKFTEPPTLLREDQLTQVLIEKYFTPEEGFYESLFGPQATRTLTPEEKATKMYIVAVAATEDDEIGISCQKDQSRNIKTFTYLAQYLGIQSQVINIDGATYGRDNVKKAVNSLQPGHNDIVVFCYSGHGFTIPGQNKKYPNIDLRSRPSDSYLDYYWNIEDIFNQIKSKGARFNLVISDCCNNDPTSSNSVGPDIAQTRSSGLGWSMDNCRKLFMDPKPMSILMSSADIGEKASCNTTFGGFFSYYFKVAMENQFSQFKANASWDDVIQDASKQTSTKAEGTYCSEVHTPENICRQHPIHQIN